MIRLTPQQASDLIGAIQDSASHAAGFADSLAMAGQTDAALHFRRQFDRLTELERLLTADGKKPVAGKAELDAYFARQDRKHDAIEVASEEIK